MIKHCTRVFFCLRKQRPTKDGTCPIHCSIASNAERLYFSTGKKCLPENWNEKKQQLRGKSEEDLLINDYLLQLRNRIFQKEIELIEKGYLITPILLKEAIEEKVEVLKNRTLLQVFREYQNIRKPLIGKVIVQDTYNDNELTGRYISEYIQYELKRTDIFLHEIKIGFIQGFHSYLLGVKKNAQNTCVKHLKFLIQLMNNAVANGYIQHNPLITYKVERQAVEIDFLTYDELQKIINFTTDIKRLEKARDSFLFGCFTGLAYVDIKTLRKEHFETDTEGRIWIKKKRQKTKILSKIPLLPIAKLILDKYKNIPGEEIIPIQHPADINRYLKDIAILCGIDKNITFHTSRHTFASTVTLANNISMEIIAKMMGHTNTRMTARYAKLVDECISEQMDRVSEIYTTNQNPED